MASIEAISGVLGKKRAAHLLRRLTFGPTREEIDEFSSKSVEEALSTLFAPIAEPLPPIDPKTGLPWIVPTVVNSSEGDLQQFFKCWLYGQMFNAGTSAIEKLTFFLHTHFTAITSVIDKSTALYYQNKLLRKYALGNIKELSLKICIDNAMLILLDNRQNENLKPNENYAREFLELYTIGKGQEIGPGNYTTYTEQDVKAAALVLSGWNTDLTYKTIDGKTGIPIGKLKLNSAQLPFKHDATTKTFSSAFQNKTIKPSAMSGNFATADAAYGELQEMVDMIFAQEATALNISRKIYRFFCYYKISDEIERDIIRPMAQSLVSGGYELKPVLELLIKSKHFFDEDDSVVNNDKKGAIIKSPLEVTIGMMRFFNIKLPDISTSTQEFYAQVSDILDAMDDQGFILYEPLDVAGYDAYFQAPMYNRNWISPNYLARRYQFAQYLLEGKNKNGDVWNFKIDAVDYVNKVSNVSDPSNGQVVAREIIDYLFPEEITAERFDFFLNILLDNLTVINWRNEWNAYKSSGDDMAIRMQLNLFLSAILQSAEYQLS